MLPPPLEPPAHERDPPLVGDEDRPRPEHDPADADVLAAMRTLVLVVDGDGRILRSTGGFGGFLGIELGTLESSNVLDHVAPEDGDLLARYLIESAGESEDAVALPMPFRLSIVDALGRRHPVDVIPTGRRHGPDAWRWTVVVVPLALNGSIVRSLDLEMAGAPRHDVCAMLCEELLVENSSWSSRWFLVDLDDPASPRVHHARPDDRSMVGAILEAVEGGGWAPWSGAEEGEIVTLDRGEIPAVLAERMIDRDWQRCFVAPVHVAGSAVAAYVMMGRVPAGFSPDEVKANVGTRIRMLLRATSLLFARWSDQRRLVVAATTDPLTGVANRDAFFAALAEAPVDSALMFLDLDDFKSINDRFGHAVGDDVLRTIARRIVERCRDGDTVARLGGDEFVVLLPGGDAGSARSFGRRLVDTVGRDLDVADGPDHVGVSVGLSTVTGTEDPLLAADRAMLLAKRQGRGRLVLA